LLSGISGIDSVKKIGQSAYVAETTSDNDIRPVLFRFEVKNDLIILTLREQQQSLENVFQELTKK
jgi:hypothetical protein